MAPNLERILIIEQVSQVQPDLLWQRAVTPTCTIVMAASTVKMRSTVKTGLQRPVNGQSVLNSVGQRSKMGNDQSRSQTPYYTGESGNEAKITCVRDSAALAYGLLKLFPDISAKGLGWGSS